MPLSSLTPSESGFLYRDQTTILRATLSAVGATSWPEAPVLHIGAVEITATLEDDVAIWSVTEAQTEALTSNMVAFWVSLGSGVGAVQILGGALERVEHGRADGNIGLTAQVVVGPTGPSAYQAAVDAGYTGTEAEWSESMAGLPEAETNAAASAQAASDSATSAAGSAGAAIAAKLAAQQAVTDVQAALTSKQDKSSLEADVASKVGAGGALDQKLLSTYVAPTGSAGRLQIHGVDIAPGQVGAATAAQGAKADVALTYDAWRAGRGVASTGLIAGDTTQQRGQGAVFPGTTSPIAFAFYRLPAIGQYSPGVRYLLRLLGRRNDTAERTMADVVLLIKREGGAASVVVVSVTNVLGTTYFSSGSAGVVVTGATCASDGSSLSVQLTNYIGQPVNVNAALQFSDVSAMIDRWVCWGDSLTRGGASPYPSQLASLSAIPSVNFGSSGETSLQIAARAGTVETRLTAALTIPAASSAVSVSMSPSTPSGVPSSQLVAIGGIIGTLTAAAGGPSFTRSKPGVATTIPAGTLVSWIDAATYADGIFVIWAGTNDWSLDQYAGLSGRVASIAAQSRTGRVIVMGPQIPSDATTAMRTAALAAESALAAACGTVYLDIRGYLISSGLSALGLTPTTQDTADIAAGIVPTQLRIDPTHLTTAAYGLVAAQVFAKAQALGYV